MTLDARDVQPLGTMRVRAVCARRDSRLSEDDARDLWAAREVVRGKPW